MESETKREIEEITLNEMGGQQMAIYTYGSVESGWLNGSAACVTRWNGRDIVSRIAGGKMCSSFGGEALAMRVIECERPNSVMIYSQSLLSTLVMDVVSMNVVVEDIKELFVKVSEKCEVVLQWVPSDEGLKGNGRMSK